MNLSIHALPLLLLLLIFLTTLPTPTQAFTPRLSALITGANRGLGLATADLLAELGYHVILTARNEDEGRARTREIQQRHGRERCEFFRLDVTDPRDVQALLTCMGKDEELREGVPNLIINNSGMCIREEGEMGKGREEVYRKTLDVNAWGPLALMEACLPRMRVRGQGCIINISSGDGELAYLHSVAAKRLEKMKSIEELKRYAYKVKSKQEEGPWPQGGLAPVPWPAYCFSKAVLNTATRLIHYETEQDLLAEVEENLRPRRKTRVRVLALCPGDVATAMCDSHAMDEALPPREAALDIIWAALHPEECPGGYFYRQRGVIPW